MRNIGVLLCFLYNVLFANAQAHLIMNNDAYIVLSDSVYLVLDNPSSNALSTTGSGGNIVSEGEANRIKWNIKDSIGTYQIPFTTTPAAQGGNDTKIPLSYEVTMAGDNGGSILFSTYETATDLNTTWASEITNMNSGILGGANGSLYTIDRFWVLNADAYTTKPNVSISFSYDDETNEMGVTNTITESNLVAQYFNTSSHIWEGLEGTVNTTANVVSPVNIVGNSYYNTWTLVDNSTPLSLGEVDFFAKDENDKTFVHWETHNEKDIKYFIIERSSDGIHFNSIGKVLSSDTYEFYDVYPEKGTNYYRLKMIDDKGKYIYSDVKEVYFWNNRHVILYPNPTSKDAYLKIEHAYHSLDLKVFDLAGKLIEINHYYGEKLISLKNIGNVTSGLYMVQLVIDNVKVETIELRKL